ncbi:hypothetical protein PENFLA_c105G08657 [Penicillium flavigenum]|uniref:Uncharacterized protein n=1 Tax=Penicillium flavigenum TaxID=254877 RepID=A0A1V6S726_9EURO|nr:hypothetical protein PENFLA_c105G08657 [Penicillium flavigenum]
MSLSSPSTISIINVSQSLLDPMADISRAFFICCQEYSATGTPLGEETTTGVEVQDGSLTPLNDSISMPAIFQNPLVIRNILNDPRIGGLKLVVYEYIKPKPGYIKKHFLSGVLDQNRSFAAFAIANLQPCIPAATSTTCHPRNTP